MEDLEARKVDIDGTIFHFGKLTAPEAFDVFERIRPGIEVLVAVFEEMPEGKIDPNDEAAKKKFLKAGVVALTQVPGATIAEMKRSLFPFVRYQHKKTKATPLDGDEETGFKDLNMVHIYEVIARAFAVNFSECWRVLNSRYLSGLDSSQQEQETSSPSSPTQ